MTINKERLLKPIETHYSGYHFRSRLEARWAVFFDSQGIEWVYEPEGFDLGEAGYYLPDFWLPHVKMWAEVKPIDFTEDEIKKAKRLAYVSSYPVLKLIGVPDIKSYFAYVRHDEHVIVMSGTDEDGYMNIDNLYDENGDPICNYHIEEVDYLLSDHHGYYTHENRFYSFCEYDEITEDSYLGATLYSAVIKARSARFEHGETPQINKKQNKEKLNKVNPSIIESVQVIRTPVVVNTLIETELDVRKQFINEGYQISPQAESYFLSYENPAKLIEYVLNTIDDSVFVIEPWHIDIKAYIGSLNGA